MAKIDTAKIEGYAEMTAEEKLKALEDFEYEDNAQELERVKTQLSKANSEAAKNKRDRDTQEAADDEAMTELKARLAELEKRDRKSSAKARLLGCGVDENAAESMAECLADAGLSDEAASSFFTELKKHIDGVAKKAKSDAMTQTTPPQGGGGGVQSVDLSKKIEEAQAAGDFSAAAYYTRLQAEAAAGK